MSIVALLSLAFVSGGTYSFYTDSETSDSNHFSAGSLLIGIDSDDTQFNPNGDSLEQGDTVIRNYVVQKNGSLDMDYSLSVNFLPGSNLDLCNALEVTVNHNYFTSLPNLAQDNYDSELKFSGLLSDLLLMNSHDGSLPIFANDFYLPNEHWYQVSVTVPEGISPLVQSSDCDFELVAQGWQVGSSYGTGFYDEGVLENSLTTANWAPQVTIHMPEDSDYLSGVVEIEASILDIDLSHYWLVIQRKSNGATVAGPGVVTHHDTIDHQVLMNWDTSEVSDGEYIIKLEARDLAGNKDPNLSPVPADPENEFDSVDWIEVKVVNDILEDVVINLNQDDENNLLIDFENADVFDNIYLYLEYEHQFEGDTVNEVVEMDDSKPLLDDSFVLEPIYIGTCSDGGLVCVPHQQVENMTISILFKDGTNILGSKDLNFNWTND